MRRRKLLWWAVVFYGCPVFNSRMREASQLRTTKGVSHSPPWPCHQLRLHLSDTPSQGSESWVMLANHRPLATRGYRALAKVLIQLRAAVHTKHTKDFEKLLWENYVQHPINNPFILITCWKSHTMDMYGLIKCIKIIQLVFFTFLKVVTRKCKITPVSYMIFLWDSAVLGLLG